MGKMVFDLVNGKIYFLYIFFFRPLGILLHYFSSGGVVSGTPHPVEWDTHISSSQFAQSVELQVGSGLQDPQQLWGRSAW